MIKDRLGSEFAYFFEFLLVYIFLRRISAASVIIQVQMKLMIINASMSPLRFFQMTIPLPQCDNYRSKDLLALGKSPVLFIRLVLILNIQGLFQLLT
jgi:hypothetical protein